MPELTKEELEKMSPEELRQLQQQQCIFCHIISGKVASKRVYEDEKCLAILDINPANPGHMLLLPKEHHSIMPLMPENDVSHLFKVARKISMAQIRSLKVDGTTIFIANGAAAGQKAPHLMIHIIPRKDNDGITAFTLPKNSVAKEDQEKLRAAIKKKVNEQFGIKEQEPIKMEKPAPETIPTMEDEEQEIADTGLPPDATKNKFDLDSISRLFGR
jgi:histidine triad (HIT) family protein